MKMHGVAENKRTLAMIVLALVAGVWARVYKIGDVVLLDDEWHAVHQLVNHSPIEFMFSFGQADYSIPLTLLYWLSSKTIGLNELLMRMPMLVAGILILVVWYRHVRAVCNERVAVLSLWFLALSPVLIQYSRTARPYMLIVALLFVSYWFFEQCRNKPLKYLSARHLAYASSTAVTAWLHLSMLPFVIAPYAYHLISDIIKGKVTRTKVVDLILLGLPAGLMTCLLIVPPIIHDYGAIAGKTGVDKIQLDTLIGASYQIYGTSSTWIVLLALPLSIIGISSLWKSDWHTRYVITGSVLMTVLIYLSAPKWVQNPQTWLRYMLPILPVLVIAMAAGLGEIISALCGARIRLRVFTSVALIYTIIWATTSPAMDYFKTSDDHHRIYSGRFQLFKPGDSRMQLYFQQYHVSPFWQGLSEQTDIETIAVGPFYVENYYWPEHLWQNASHKKIIPMQLGGVCMEKRRGETYAGSGIDLRNRVLLDNVKTLNNHNITLMVLNKPQWIEFENAKGMLGDPIDDCIQYMQKHYGEAWYEDEYVIAFRR